MNVWEFLDRNIWTVALLILVLAPAISIRWGHDDDDE